MPFTNFCCRSGGSNLNAGTRTGDTTEPGLTADLTYTGGTWVNSTRVFTVASGDPVADGVAVGDYIALDTGAAAATFFGRVSGVTSTTITVAATSPFFGTNPANGTYTLRVGGAWAGPGGTSAFPFNVTGGTFVGLINASNHPARINLKNDAVYDLTAATTWNQTGRALVQGYTTTYGDGGKATIRGPETGAAIVLATLTGSFTWYRDLIFRRNGNSGSAALVTMSATRNVFYCCEFHDSRGIGANSTQANEFVRCLATNNLGGGFFGTAARTSRCVATGNTNYGFSVLSATQCLAFANTGASTDGFSAGATIGTFVGCVSHGNGRHGFIFSGSNSGFAFTDCIATNNGGFGYVGGTTGTTLVLENCAAWSNTSGSLSNTLFDESDYPGFLALAADPYVDAANGDFNLNTTAGGGADLRAVNYAALGAADTTMYPYSFWAEPSGGGGGGGAVILSGF